MQSTPYETKNAAQLQLNSRVAKNGANLQKNPLPNSWFWIFMVPFYSEYVKIYIKLNKPPKTSMVTVHTLPIKQRMREQGMVLIGTP